MSDESSYYSPGEVPDDEKENKVAKNDPLFRNLMSEFQDDLKQNADKPSDNREPMKVFLRVRPFSNDELKASEDQGCLKIVDEKAMLLRAPEDSFTFKSSIRGIAEQTHQFSFTKIYDENTTQKDIFDDSILGYVKDFLDGINCLIFTYGVTNSGKTFTIQGNPKNGGILPRTLDVLFNSIKGKQYDHMDLKPTMYQEVTKLTKEQQSYEEVLKKAVTNAGQRENIDMSVLWKMDTTSQSDTSTISTASTGSSNYVTANDADYSSISEEVKERVCDGTVLDTDSQGPVKFCIWVSFAEIYNEYIYDLLDPTPAGKGKKRPVLKLGDDKKGNPFVKGLKEIQVNSADEAFKVVRVGQKNQNIASTKLNQHSSRSHSIFTIKILRVVDVDQPHVVRISRLSFVDLAGSERYCKTQSTGNRLKEASNINTSIMTLGKCIEYLRYNQLHKNHPLIVPFRETKLTRLFQGFFLGKGKAGMIVNISQCASMFDETYNVLKFSAIAKQVKTKSIRNTDLFKPKQLPKSSLTAMTPATANKKSWVGLTTPRPIQKAVLYESMCGDGDEQLQELLASYEELRKQLLDERRKNAIMELKIREEVCSEMSEQIIEIEKNYSERLQEEQQTLEEQCERRIEMLTKSMKKSRKRKKIDRIADDDDSYVSSVLLHAEKVKVKDRDEVIRNLRAKLAEKETEHEFYRQTHTPEQHPRAIVKLQVELDEANETLKLHEGHIDDLQTKLTTTQDCLEERDIEVEKLKEVVDVLEATASNKEIAQLKDLLRETSCALDEARKKLDHRDGKLREKGEQIAKLNEQIAVQKDGSAAKSELESFERELRTLEVQGKLLHERNEFLSSELKQLRTEKEVSEEQLKSAVDKAYELKRQLEESEDRREQFQFKDEERGTKIRRFENIIKNHETALADSESIIEQLNEKIADLKAAKEQAQDENHAVPEGVVPLSNGDWEEKMRNLEAENKRLEKLKQGLEMDNLERKARNLELETEVLKKEKDREDEGARYENDIDDLRRRLDGMGEALAIKEEETNNVKEVHSLEMKELIEKQEQRESELKAKIDGYEESVERLNSEIERMKNEMDEQKSETEYECDEMASDQGHVESETSYEEKESRTKPGGKNGKKTGLKQENTTMKSRLEVLRGVKTKASMRPASRSGPRSPYKSNLAALKEMEKALKETTAALEKKNSQVVLRNKKISELEDAIKQFENDVEILSEEKGSLEGKIEAYDGRVKELEAEIIERSSEMKESREEQLRRKEGTTKMVEEIDELRKKIALLKEVKGDLENVVETLRKKSEDYVCMQETSKSEIEALNKKLADSESSNEICQRDIAQLKAKLADLDGIHGEVEAMKKENVDLRGKIEHYGELEAELVQLKMSNESLQTEVEAAIKDKDEMMKLKAEMKGLKVENSSLIDDIASKNSEQRSMVAELNQRLEENVQLKSKLYEATETVSSLELQIQLRKTEKELESMHTKEQVMTALVQASKKEESRLKEMSTEIAEREGIIQGLKNELEARKSEIEDLAKQVEEDMGSKRELVKKQQTIHDLRCSIMKKDEQLKERTLLEQKIVSLEEKLKDFDEVRFQKETMTMQIETLKRTVNERDQQILTARREIEKLEKELHQQIERDRSSNFQTPKVGGQMLSDKKKSGNSSQPGSLRRSTRIRKIPSLKKSSSEENEERVAEEGSSSKKKFGRRKVLFDLNEGSASEVFEADTPGSAKTEKPKRRRLLSKNVGLCAESPQMIPPSPTKQKDDVDAIVRRQLRSTYRR